MQCHLRYDNIHVRSRETTLLLLRVLTGETSSSSESEGSDKGLDGVSGLMGGTLSVVSALKRPAEDKGFEGVKAPFRFCSQNLS